jgi:hypothetical protein
MASTESSSHMNGNYAPQGYENSYATGASNFTPSQQPTDSQTAQQTPAAEVPKDEIGWYFVEQYYTTLSKSPERLYVSSPAQLVVLSGHTTNWAPSFSTTSAPSTSPASRRRRSAFA